MRHPRSLRATASQIIESRNTMCSLVRREKIIIASASGMIVKKKMSKNYNTSVNYCNRFGSYRAESNSEKTLSASG